MTKNISTLNLAIQYTLLILVANLVAFIIQFFPQYVSDVQRLILTLPLIITVPSIIGLAIIATLLRTLLSRISSISVIFILSYIIGAHVLYTLVVILFYLRLYYVISLIPYIVPLIALCINILLLIHFFKQTNSFKPISPSFLRASDTVMFIAIMLWGVFWALISRLDTPFPRLPPDIAGPFDFIQPMIRLFEHGFIGKTRVLLLILSSFTSAYSHTPPEAIVWGGTILISALYALGIFLLVKKLTDNMFISIMSAILAIVLNKGTDIIFHSTVIHLFRYTTFMQALFPYAILLFIWVLEQISNGTERRKILKFAFIVSTIAVLLDTLIPLMLFQNGIVPHFRLYRIIVFNLLLLVVILLAEIWAKNIAIPIIVVTMTIISFVFHMTYQHVLYILVLITFIFLYVKKDYVNTRQHKYIVLISFATMVLAVINILYFNPNVIINSLNSINNIIDHYIAFLSKRVAIFRAARGLFIEYTLPIKVHALNMANIQPINWLIATSSVALLPLSHKLRVNGRIQKFNFVFSLLLLFVYILYLAPFFYLKLIYRFLEIFQAGLVSSALYILIFKVLCSSVPVHKDNKIFLRGFTNIVIKGIAIFVVTIIVLAACIAPYRRALWPNNVLYDYDYEAIHYLRIYTPENARIISDYYTFRMYTAMANKIWPIEDRMLPVALTNQSLNIIRGMKLIFNVSMFVENPSRYLRFLNNYLTYYRCLIANDYEEPVYVRAARLNPCGPVYITVNPRTIEWSKKASIYKVVIYPHNVNKPIENNSIVKLLDLLPFMKIVFRSAYVHIWLVNMSILHNFSKKIRVIPVYKGYLVFKIPAVKNPQWIAWHFNIEPFHLTKLIHNYTVLLAIIIDSEKPINIEIQIKGNNGNDVAYAVYVRKLKNGLNTIIIPINEEQPIRSKGELEVVKQIVIGFTAQRYLSRCTLRIHDIKFIMFNNNST